MINKASGSLSPKEMIARISDPLGDLSASRRSAIFSNVQQAARVLKRPPAPRLTSVRRELKEARKRYKENPAQHVDLSEEARLYVRVALVDPMSRTEDWFDFGVEDIDKAIEVIEADVLSNMANRGGRMSDDRLYQFATSLAQIYTDETGFQPKHTVDPVTQECASPFNKFVLAALREFYPEGPVPWAAAREAMRRVLLVDWDPGNNIEPADANLDAEQD